MNEQNPIVRAWDDAGRPHPFATFRDGYEAAARGTDAKPINVSVVAEVIEINGEKWLEWALEGGIDELELGDELVWADRSITGERGKGIVYAAPAPTETSAWSQSFLKSVISLCNHHGASPDAVEGFDPHDKWIADLWRRTEVMLAGAAPTKPTVYIARSVLDDFLAKARDPGVEMRVASVPLASAPSKAVESVALYTGLVVTPADMQPKIIGIDLGENGIKMVRDAALEEAAVEAEHVGRPVGAGDGNTYIPGSSADAAKAIRALKSQPPIGARAAKG